jgi:hypothetical protein
MTLSESGTKPRQPGAATDEKYRRQVVTLVTLIYLLLIFEGALRKWVLTGFGSLLFFIRDPFVLLVYWLALRHSFFPRGNALLQAGVAFGCIGVFLVAVQAAGVASGIDKWPILATYGWRNYFLYIPLPFIIGEVFEPRDVQRIVKITCLLAIPIALLVFMQFRSSPEAPINVGFGASVEQQFHGLTVDMNHTRPMGTYTSDIGQKQFDLSCFAMLLALWISPRSRRFLKSWQLMAATCAVLTCLAVSGSRGAMIGSGIVAIAAVASAAVLRGSGASARAIFLPSVLVVVAVMLYPIVFPEGYSTFMARWNGAEAAEAQNFSLGVFGRALYGFYEFFNIMGNTPIAGYGIGLAGNASLTLGVTIPGFNGWAENDWTRHIVDLGPFFGVAFIMYRVAFVSWLGVTCLAGARRTGSPLALLLFSYIGVELLYGELTGHGIVNGYGWLFAGLCLAACKLPTQVVAAVGAADEAILISPPPFANLLR